MKPYEQYRNQNRRFGRTEESGGVERERRMFRGGDDRRGAGRRDDTRKHDDGLRKTNAGKGVQAAEELRQMLESIDRKSYPAYKMLAGRYRFPNFTLSIDHVQGDPFASPSHLSVFVTHGMAGFDAALYETEARKVALADLLLRRFGKETGAFQFQAKGSGKSGLLSVSRPGQEILERTACEITQEGIWLRFHAGFPANGRTINAGELEKILFDFVPACVKAALFASAYKQQTLAQTAALADDQAYIRAELRARGLVAFVADGAVLPRQSGVSDLPMKDGIQFRAPERLRVTMTLPHKGQLSGMGIPKGVTLITGGGYHGKSTLLKALEMGVYNHIAGDGREYVITDATALKLRAEDGRFIDDTDISLFINDLPNKKNTEHFSTEDASGSTSQAAGIVEGIFAGCGAFLIDEDTSAANFMVRDGLMQKIINRDKEPITPFIERARQMYEQLDISTILVAGSSGAFFHIADTVIQMDNYEAHDITEKVKTILAETEVFAYTSASKTTSADSAQRQGAVVPAFHLPKEHPYRVNGKHMEEAKVKVFDKDSFSIDRSEVSLRYVEQLTDSEQTTALAYILRRICTELADGCTLSTLVKAVEQDWAQKGFPAAMQRAKGSAYTPSGLARPRAQEIYACLARYRR